MTTEPVPPVPPGPQIALPSRVPVGPIPTAIDLDVIEIGGGQQAVGMRIQDPGGVKIVILTPDQAKAFAEQLKNAAVRAGLGLVVPSVRLP